MAPSFWFFWSCSAGFSTPNQGLVGLSRGCARVAGLREGALESSCSEAFRSFVKLVALTTYSDLKSLQCNFAL